MRTILVASATLGILIVSFLIYQFGQEDFEVVARDRTPPLPSVLEGSFELPIPEPESKGVAVGQTIIGPGEKIHITLYPREGTRAQLELAVTDWTPIAGSADEFLLTDPDVRMRTPDGHGVRFTAKRGTLEADRSSRGGLKPKRGTLSGDVVIQYDRLTEKQRAELPEELRDKIDPNDLIEMRVGEIEFDLEFSKLIAPGRLVVTARDMHLDAADLEVRFDEATGRVDSVRMQGAGRIEFEEFGTAQPEEGRVTLVEWFRASLQAKLELRRAATPAAEKEPEAAPAIDDAGVPVFRSTSDEPDPTKPAVRYFALIEGEVRATRVVNEDAATRLEADRLEIVREMARGRDSANGPDAAGDANKVGETSTGSHSRVVLEWVDRFVIEPCGVDDSRCEGATSRITAHGNPGRMEAAEGGAVFTRMAYDPESGAVELTGRPDEPVIVTLPGQGTITGMTVHTDQVDDFVHIRVEGPGSLVRAGAPAELDAAGTVSTSAEAATVRFSDELHVYVREVKQTSFDLANGITRRKEWVIDRAVFTGDVQMREGDTGLDADRLELTFRPSRLGFGGNQTIKSATARGHVVMTSGADRLTCREMDVSLGVDPDGRPVPRSATARGDVVARQGSRVIRARDRLDVEFDSIERPAAPFDPVAAYAAAVDAGLDVDAIDWEARRVEHEARRKRETIVKRLHAFGNVVVRDPDQPVAVDAEELDCTITDGREIEKALVVGREGQPAFVSLETMTVTGRRISLDLAADRADVPGAGRLTFLSKKGLDGRSMGEPVPVEVTWTDSMRYRGRDNRADFSGHVHATSQNTIEYNSDHLLVEFDDVAEVADASASKSDWAGVQDFVGRLTSKPYRSGSRSPGRRFSKEPINLLATGRVVVVNSEFDPETKALTSRARIAGAKLWVNLRPEVSKMQIEGAGTLLLEDLSVAEEKGPSVSNRPVGLFEASEDSGPSNTLIEWDELMWYDFSTDQTRFEGDVSLKHFSGAQLARIRRGLPVDSTEAAVGRATFLNSDSLTVQFAGDDARTRSAKDRRIGRLSVDRLQKFQASGAVVLQDESEGLSVTADRIVYWSDREVLAIYGSKARKAHIVIQRPGELPTQANVERLFYNLRSGDLEVSQPALWSR